MSAGELELPDPDLVTPPAIRTEHERPPLIVDGQVVGAPYRSPLDIDPETGDYPTALRGGVITSPVAIEAIRRRVEYGALPLWRRAITRPPPGWRPTPTTTTPVAGRVNNGQPELNTGDVRTSGPLTSSRKDH